MCTAPLACFARRVFRSQRIRLLSCNHGLSFQPTSCVPKATRRPFQEQSFYLSLALPSTQSCVPKSHDLAALHSLRLPPARSLLLSVFRLFISKPLFLHAFSCVQPSGGVCARRQVPELRLIPPLSFAAGSRCNALLSAARNSQRPDSTPPPPPLSSRGIGVLCRAYIIEMIGI